jgi:hypothetical protein
VVADTKVDLVIEALRLVTADAAVAAAAEATLQRLKSPTERASDATKIKIKDATR